jgi:hypothetical protein
MQGHSATRPDRRWLILVVVAVAQLMVMLDAAIVTPDGLARSRSPSPGCSLSPRHRQR